MKTTVVPAQVTTIEDKIAGNLGVSQLILLIAPVFVGGALFIILPPFFSYAVYKVVAMVCLAVLCGVLAIRIKGKILLLWIIVISRYNLRPRYYIFDKNDTHLRQEKKSPKTETVPEKAEPVIEAPEPLPSLSTSDLVKAESILGRPDSNLRLHINKKGKLSVHITEVR